MDMHKLVADYIDAWNRHDVAGVLELMHEGAAFYDAFWTESCVGRELAQYFRDSFEEEPYRYEQDGEVILTEHGVVFRYSAYHSSGPKRDDYIYSGAEVLTVRDGRILTVSDHYYSPERETLEEVAELSAKRHGVPSFTERGLGSLRLSRLKARLVDTMVKDQAYREPDLTMSRLAETVGCSVEHLTIVIENKLNSSFESLLAEYRTGYARTLLENEADGPGCLVRIAREAGFQALVDFENAFTSVTGMNPTTFLEKNNTDASASQPFLH